MAAKTGSGNLAASLNRDRSPDRINKRIWLTVGLCLFALAVLWINDLLMACRTTLPSGVTRWDSLVMVVIVLFFFSVLSLFPHDLLAFMMRANKMPSIGY
jgi:hypothetical protein